MEVKVSQLYLTNQKFFTVNLWQPHYQILLIILPKEFLRTFFLILKCQEQLL